MSSTARRRVIAVYMDSITLWDISPKGKTQQQEGYTPVNQCVRSSSKLPRLGGSTKRHFPVKITTKGTQLGVESHTYQCISNIHAICTICVDTTWHHNITLWLKYSLMTHKSQHNVILQTGGHMTQHSSDTSIKRKQNMSGYRHLLKWLEEPESYNDPTKGTRPLSRIPKLIRSTSNFTS